MRENHNTSFFYGLVIVLDFVLIAFFDRGFDAYFDTHRTVPLDLDLLVERVGMLITVAIATTVVMCTFYDRMSYYLPVSGFNLTGGGGGGWDDGIVFPPFLLSSSSSLDDNTAPPHHPPFPPGPGSRHEKTPDAPAIE